MLLRGRCGFDSRREYQNSAPCFRRGRNFGISIGEDLPHEVRRFAPTQSAQGRSPKYSRREYHFDHKILWSFSLSAQYLGEIFKNWYKNRVIPENFTIQQKGMTVKVIPFTLSVNYTIKCNRRDKKVVHQSLMTTEHFSHSPEDIKYA